MGHAAAQLNLGVLYAVCTVAEWRSKAAAQGHAQATTMLDYLAQRSRAKRDCWGRIRWEWCAGGSELHDTL